MNVDETNKEQNEARRERFEFVLSINDNIIVQRFFRIMGFNELSLYTSDLKDTIDSIVNLIDDDLKSKSRTYMYYGYGGEEEVEYDEFNIKPFDGVGESYVGSVGTKVTKHLDLKLTRLADKAIFVKPDEFVTTIGHYDKPKEIDGVKTYLYNYENELKFEFKVDRRTVISKVWSGDTYPSFVRNNIDITNRRYANSNPNDRRLTKEASLIRRMVRFDYNEEHESVTVKTPNSLIKEGSKDLVPIIIKKLCDVCSSNDFYGLKQEYGDKTYGVRFYRSKETGEFETPIKPVLYDTKR